MIYNVRNNQYQVRDANPEYDSVEASQGTKVCDKNSPKNQVEKTAKKILITTFVNILKRHITVYL